LKDSQKGKRKRLKTNATTIEKKAFDGGELTKTKIGKKKRGNKEEKDIIP